MLYAGLEDDLDFSAGGAVTLFEYFGVFRQRHNVVGIATDANYRYPGFREGGGVVNRIAFEILSGLLRETVKGEALLPQLGVAWSLAFATWP
jgi:hypothetical protein